MFLQSWTRDCCSSKRLRGARGCLLTRRLSSSHKYSMTLRSGDYEGHGSWWIFWGCSSACLFYYFENWRHYVILRLLLMMWYLNLLFFFNLLVNRFKRNVYVFIYSYSQLLLKSIVMYFSTSSLLLNRMQPNVLSNETWTRTFNLGPIPDTVM